MAEKDPKDYGSQYWLRLAVNDGRELMNRETARVLDLPPGEEIEWLSPLPPAYTEYQDQQFLDQLGITLSEVPLREFWPKGGPVWDALARTNRGKALLIEAKAHIPEINTPQSGATPKSLQHIARSLNETRAFLNANHIVDWTRTFFQYTNRLAHLYLLRQLNKVDAYLVNVYFINESHMQGPSTVEEWRGALTLLKAHLGIARTKFSPFIKEVFLDIEELRELANKRLQADGLQPSASGHP
jgi:hypothetical protein